MAGPAGGRPADPLGDHPTVPLAAGVDAPDLPVGTAVPLFRPRLASGSNIPSGVLSKPQYAVASDGRFLMNLK